MFGVDFDMGLVTEIGFLSPLLPKYRPCFSLSLLHLHEGHHSFSMTWIRRYERCVLDHAFLYIVPFSSKLVCELVPDGFVLSRFFKSLAKEPGGCNQVWSRSSPRRLEKIFYPLLGALTVGPRDRTSLEAREVLSL